MTNNADDEEENINDNTKIKQQIKYYEGNWLNDKMNGFGKLSIDSKIKYEGEFKDDKYHGKGIEHFSHGEFNGTFENGLRMGYGEFTWKNIDKIFKGNYLNNKKNGFGKLYENKKLIYEGDFRNDKYNGIGKCFKDGGVYKGNFKNGKLCGLGKFYVKKFLRYVGEFENGNFHGKGKKYTDLLIISGIFKEGELKETLKEIKKVKKINQISKEKLLQNKRVRGEEESLDTENEEDEDDFALA